MMETHIYSINKIAPLLILYLTVFTCENDDTPFQEDPIDAFLNEGKTY